VHQLVNKTLVGNTDFVLGRFGVQISVQRPVIVMEVCGFPSSILYRTLGCNPIRPLFFRTYSPCVLTFFAIYFKLLTLLLNKELNKKLQILGLAWFCGTSTHFKILSRALQSMHIFRLCSIVTLLLRYGGNTNSPMHHLIILGTRNSNNTGFNFM
jgi:hypothetical protein